MSVRSHSVCWLIAIAGCGRISFDAVGGASDGGGDGVDGPAPELVVAETADDLTVSAEGRFLLRFAKSRDWFAVDWRDATAPAEDLVPDITDLDKTVLQGIMFEVPGSDFQGTGAGENRVFQVIERDATHVVFRSEFDIDFGVDVVHAIVTNDLDRDGNWKIEATFHRVAGTTQIDTLEVADSHVNPAFAWTQTPATGGYTWRRDGTGLRATLRVTGPSGSAEPMMDELNNLYFSESTLTMPVTRAWSCVIWPPT